MQKIGAHNIRLDPFDQRLEGLHGTSAPADKRAFRNIGAHAGKNLVQAIKR
jgi:hypothetical protein